MQHHLIILAAKYLEAILSGRKTAECRLSRVEQAPYQAVRPGDLLWLKEVSGPVRAVATAGRVHCFKELDPSRLGVLRRRFNGDIAAPASFWQLHHDARFATLIWLESICPLTPFRIAKTDRRAWVVLHGPPVPGQSVLTASQHLA